MRSTMANQRLRWGILGCARITRRGLIPGILRSETGLLTGLASRELSTANAWKEEFGVERAYGSYEELVNDSAIDAVYIPLPNELHKPWVFAAADAGKHILCEKPLALNASDAESMVRHCQQRGVVLMEAFMWRHQPRTNTLLAMVRGGTIGDLRLIRASFSFPIGADDWRLDPARGGGALWDVGCYGLNTARFFTEAEPQRVQAVARFSRSGVDLGLAASMLFPNDVLATLDCAFDQPFRCAFELVGSRGVIEVPDAYLPPEKPCAFLRVTDRAPERLDLSEQGPERLEFNGRNQYAAMVDAFTDSIAEGRLVDCAEDGLAQMTALEAIRQAARTS